MNIAVSFLAVVVLSSWGIAQECRAAPQPDGAALYRKHCSGCHPDAARLKAAGDLVSLMRYPPSSMPAFSEEKLPDGDARKIAAFLLPAKPEAGRDAPASRPVTTAPAAAAAAAPAPVPAAPATAESGAPRAAVRLPKDGKAKFRSFLKTWTVKGTLNGEEVTILTFELAANANNEIVVIPSLKPSDDEMTITSFEITDRTLNMQFKWKRRGAASYWKVETHALMLSRDGGRMTGSYTLQTTGGTNMDFAVWAEPLRQAVSPPGRG